MWLQAEASKAISASTWRIRGIGEKVVESDAGVTARAAEQKDEPRITWSCPCEVTREHKDEKKEMPIFSRCPSQGLFHAPGERGAGVAPH
jgi:hypothetical protein